MIKAENISKSYAKALVLDGIDFTAGAGKSTVIVGRNGAGKSTFLSILAGFLQPDGGSVATNGKIAFCPQNDNLFEELTVKDNLLFWAKASGGSFDLDNLNLSGLFEVDKYIHKKICHLSGGMKKCVAILCALTVDAKILVLDEPFSGLDIFYKNILLKAFKELRSQGNCIIYTSHNIDEITGLDNTIYTLSNGKLEYMDMQDNMLECLLDRLDAKRIGL
ncbi:MAG: ABC transporter ATP-binding protein [Defluviitaleaceae bacterium]|nr:ABC transporter ATP-binding protein [Defluviitaleaceae bacterium]